MNNFILKVVLIREAPHRRARETMKYIRVSQQKGIEVLETDEMPKLKPMQTSTDASVKCVYRRFSDHRIAIVGDAKAPQKQLPVVAVSPIGEPLHGDLLILGLKKTIDWVDFAGLTDDQVTIVQNQLKVVN
jgi:hypothetical protein